VFIETFCEDGMKSTKELKNQQTDSFVLLSFPFKESLFCGLVSLFIQIKAIEKKKFPSVSCLKSLEWQLNNENTK